MKKPLFFIATFVASLLTSCVGGSSNKPTNSSESIFSNNSDTSSIVDSNNTSADSTLIDSSTSSSEIAFDEKEQQNIDSFHAKYTLSDFFSIDNRINVKIDMNKDELIQLSEDYDAYPHHSSPIYRKCNVTLSINDDVLFLKNVGIRLKGNTSRRKFVDSNGDIYALVHFKLSFTEIFDDISYSKEEEERIDDRKILGLKKLDLKWNKNYDTTHIKEYVAHQLYKEYGVIDENVGFSQVILNDTNLGLYLSYEPIDKQFIKKNFEKSLQGGDLYKTTYTNRGPANFTHGSVGTNIGEEDEDADNKNGFFPTYDIKTNEDETTHQHLLNLINVLNKANSIDEIEQVVDLDSFVKFEAISYVCGDPDDLRNNYNNTYTYFYPDSGKALFIPYDKDRVFGITKDWNPSNSGMSDIGALSNRAVGANENQANPLYNKVLINPLNNNYKYQNEYINMITDIFTNSTVLKDFNNIFNKVKEKYGDIVIADNSLESVEFSLEDNQNLAFDYYISEKQRIYNNY